jgi:hypothetical protein
VGVHTGSGDVAARIANMPLDPTFLMADVEIGATCELFNVNRTRLENIIHRVFAPARLDITINDRFGNSIVPRECFLVPLFVIDRGRPEDRGRHHRRLRLRSQDGRADAGGVSIPRAR